MTTRSTRNVADEQEAEGRGREPPRLIAVEHATAAAAAARPPRNSPLLVFHSPQSVLPGLPPRIVSTCFHVRCPDAGSA